MAENSLALLSRATQMLAEVKTIDDAKYLMDIASTAKHYARKHKLGKEAVSHAREIEIKAEILLGEFLAEIEKNKGAVEHADRCTALEDNVWAAKYAVITDVYGFAPDSFEARTTPHAEAFWCFKVPTNSGRVS